MTNTLLVLLFLASQASSETQVREFDAKGILRLHLTNGFGPIRIRALASGKAKVTAITDKSFGPGCELQTDIREQSLEVSVKTEKDGKPCSVSFEIELPKTSDVRIRNGSGDVSIAGLHGAVMLKQGNGQVKLESSVTDLEIESGNGDLEGTSLSGPALIHAGNGDITLGYAKVPSKGALEAKLGNGNVRVRLPADAKFELEHKAGMGEVKSEFPSTPGAPFKIAIKAGLGDVVITRE